MRKEKKRSNPKETAWQMADAFFLKKKINSAGTKSTLSGEFSEVVGWSCQLWGGAVHSLILLSSLKVFQVGGLERVHFYISFYVVLLFLLKITHYNILQKISIDNSDIKV